SASRPSAWSWRSSCETRPPRDVRISRKAAKPRSGNESTRRRFPTGRLIGRAFVSSRLRAKRSRSRRQSLRKPAEYSRGDAETRRGADCGEAALYVRRGGKPGLEGGFAARVSSASPRERRILPAPTADSHKL